MDRLANAHLAIIDQRKITHYLLASEHPAGRAKAGFFRGFGFRRSEWRELEKALLEHALTATVVALNETAFGRKYIVDGPLRSPDGRMPQVRAIWFVTVGEIYPRLVTVYPMQGSKSDQRT